MSKIKQVSALIGAGAMLVSLFGCGSAGVGGGDPINKKATALGESGCGPVYETLFGYDGPAADGKDFLFGPSCSPVTYTSPDTSYTNDDGTYSCPNQLIADFVGTSDNYYPIQFLASWDGPGLTESDCSLAEVTLGAYGLKTTTSTWELLGTRIYTGTWVTGQISFCDFEVTGGSGITPLPAGQTTYSRVRTAAEAVGFIFKEKVTTGVLSGGPCAPVGAAAADASAEKAAAERRGPGLAPTQTGE
jgi:hypothetical protein